MTMESTQDRKVLKSMRGDEPTLDTCENWFPILSMLGINQDYEIETLEKKLSQRCPS